jgi:hypothetical protein
VQSTERTLTEKDLKNWNMLQVFEEAVARVFSQARLPATFSDPGRQLSYGRYLSLFLFGLFNPVVESMRSCGDQLKGPGTGVQARVSRQLSEMQHARSTAAKGLHRRDRRLSAANRWTHDWHLVWYPRRQPLECVAAMAWPNMEWDAMARKGVRLVPFISWRTSPWMPASRPARIGDGRRCARCVAGQTNVGDAIT